MIWEELFSWSNQKVEILNLEKPKVITENVLIKRSTFNNIINDSTISVVDQSYYCSIDYCFFIGCSSKDADKKVGCIHFKLTNDGSLSITRTIADSCMSKYEGNFARIEVSVYGSIFVLMTSVDRCAPDFSHETYHSILMKSGTQIVKNINTTRCYANRHSGFTNILALVAQVDFCNVVDNMVQMTNVYAITGNSDVRRVNFIHNKQNTVYPSYSGIIGAYYGLSSSLYRITFSDCVIENNTGYLISVYNTAVTLIGCSLDSSNFDNKNGAINNISPHTRQPVTMTLMAGHGKHADIPYGVEMTAKNFSKNGIIVAFGLMTMLSEGINFAL